MLAPSWVDRRQSCRRRTFRQLRQRSQRLPRRRRHGTIRSISVRGAERLEPATGHLLFQPSARPDLFGGIAGYGSLKGSLTRPNCSRTSSISGAGNWRADHLRSRKIWSSPHCAGRQQAAEGRQDQPGNSVSLHARFLRVRRSFRMSTASSSCTSGQGRFAATVEPRSFNSTCNRVDLVFRNQRRAGLEGAGTKHRA